MASFTGHLEPSPVTKPSAAPNTFLPRETIPSPAVRFGGHQPQVWSGSTRRRPVRLTFKLQTIKT